MTKEQLETIKRSALGKEQFSPCAEPDGTIICETVDCAFNNDGFCRYHAVYGELPIMTEEDGCLCGAFMI